MVASGLKWISVPFSRVVPICSSVVTVFRHFQNVEEIFFRHEKSLLRAFQIMHLLQMHQHREVLHLFCIRLDQIFRQHEVR